MELIALKKLIPLILALSVFLSGCGVLPGTGDSAGGTGSQITDEPDQSTPPVTDDPGEESTPPVPTGPAGPSVTDEPVDPSPSPTTGEDPEDSPPPTEPPAVIDDEPLVGLVAECEPVDKEWFYDAVFIGDSRTDGLKLYGGIKGATYLSYKGLSVFSVDSNQCIPIGEEKVTVLDALALEQYGKVFIMLGVNELGYDDVESFRRAYSDLVTTVKEIQPNAIIYLQIQPPVNEEVAQQNGMAWYVTNERVDRFNEQIIKVAEEHGTALVNVAEVLSDENGILPADLTSDGVHMRRGGYTIWADYLRTHTGTTPFVVPEPDPAESEDPVGNEDPVGSEDPVEREDPTQSPDPATGT